LNLRFGHLENLRVLHGNQALAAPATTGATGPFDTVLALNVIQRLADDTTALKNYFSLLAPGGTLILMVPAQPGIKNHIDESLGHQRRYDAGDLRQKLLAAGFTIRNMQDFNRMGSWGWWISGACGMRHLSQRQMRLFDALLPLAKLWEYLRLGRGLNLIAIADKPK
jgi:SAM-dependent methyltransferase